VSLEASAARALRRLDELRPDLILLDVDMPDMDGIEALREIRARDASVIVVMVTGTIDRAVMDQAMSLGAHAFVPKPFRIASVIEAVRAALATRPAC
jgi:two-component system chemotaxis response regulator CheY